MQLLMPAWPCMWAVRCFGDAEATAVRCTDLALSHRLPHGTEEGCDPWLGRAERSAHRFMFTKPCSE